MCDFWQDENKQIWMTRKQIGEALEYLNPNDAVRLNHERHKGRLDKYSVSFKLNGTDGNKYKTYLYSAKGVMEVCRWSKQPKADVFMDWVWDAIDEIRKTGHYSTKQKLDSYMIEDPIERAKRWIEEQQEKNS